MLGYQTRDRIQKQLDVILANPTDHRGLQDVAKQVGLTRHALKYWFRQHARELVRKKRAAENRYLAQRYQEQHEYLRGAMQRMVAQGIYPSKRRVNEALSVHRTSLMRPDLFEAYTLEKKRHYD